MGWDDTDKSAGGGDYLKVDAGQSALVHIISEAPHSFKQFFSKALNKGCIVPEDLKVKGLSYRHGLVVYDYVDKALKIWIMSKTVANDVKAIWQTYKSLANLDLQITRTGTQLATKYRIVPVQSQFDPQFVVGQELPNMEEELAIDSPDRINAIMSGVDPGSEVNPATLAPAAAPPVAGAPMAAPPEVALPAPAPLASPPGIPAEDDAWAPPGDTAAPPTPMAAPPGLAPAPPVPAPAPVPAAKTNGNAKPAGSATKTALLRKAQHAFASKPKFGKGKAKEMAIRTASKSAKFPKGKAIMSQLSIAELEKLVTKIG